jgi:two-component system LytT family response regulator
MLMQLRTIIADDEPIARKGMEEELKEIDFISIAGIAENSFQALQLIAGLRPDLLLLDIEMPGLNGLELIKSLTNPPMVIITTAYPEYALEGYVLDVMDYLIKPIDFHRLLKACTRAKEFHQLKQQATGPGSGKGDYIFVKCNGKHEKVILSEILFVEAADNYIVIYLAGKKMMVYQTLKNMEAMLPPAHFMKVHKSFIVAIEKVSGLEGHELAVQQFRIPVSRNLKENVLAGIINKK